MAQPMSNMDLINQAKKEVGEMTPEKLKKLLDEAEDVIVLDVRESEQRSEGSIPSDDISAENFFSITRGNLEWEVAQLIKDKDAVIVTYCRRGGRGALASKVLREMGYKNARRIKGLGKRRVSYKDRFRHNCLKREKIDDYNCTKPSAV